MAKVPDGERGQLNDGPTRAQAFEGSAPIDSKVLDIKDEDLMASVSVQLGF